MTLTAPSPSRPHARRPEVSPAALYDAALRQHAAGRPVGLWAAAGGERRALPVRRWCRPGAGLEAPDAAAMDVLRRAVRAGAAVLDLGCGPGRHAGYLAGRGLRVLGVDTSSAAVAMTRARGAQALLGDALEALPEGPRTGTSRRRTGWDAILLLDGNIGIGGDPDALLRRVRTLMPASGRLLVELDEDGVSDRQAVRLSDGPVTSTPFPWARLGRQDLPAAAAQAGMEVLRDWTDEARVFALVGTARR